MPKGIYTRTKPSGFKGKHHTEKAKEKNSKAHKGKIPWNKIGGGINPLIKIIRLSSKYKEWRLQVFGRDNFTCQKCGVRGTYLEPHHIKSFASMLREFNICTLEESRTCDNLWDLNNGITLCKECHSKTDNYKGRNKMLNIIKGD